MFFMDLEKKFSNLTTYNIDNMKIIIEILHHIMIKIVVTRLEDVFLLTLKGKLSIWHHMILITMIANR